MPYLIGALVVLLLITLLAVLGCGSGRPSEAKGPGETPPSVPASDPAKEVKLPSRADLQKRLQALALSDAPKDLAQVALCYEVAERPKRGEYVCPKCGERTLYARRDLKEQKDRDASESMILRLGDVPSCRELARQIPGLPVELEEKGFCKKCDPGAEWGHVILIIRYPGEKEPHRVEGIGSGDLRLMREFLAGKRKFPDGYGMETTAMKKHVPRLAKLLGVKIAGVAPEEGEE